MGSRTSLGSQVVHQINLSHGWPNGRSDKCLTVYQRSDGSLYTYNVCDGIRRVFKDNLGKFRQFKERTRKP